MIAKEDQWLVDNIIQYVEENNRKYAVAIEGPWGVGKTRFLKSVLAPALKDHKKRMVRVSMFGMENSNDLYEKIGITLLRLERDDSVKRKASITVFFKSLPSVLGVALKSFGFSPKINITFKDVADLVPSDKHVFVFDDVERRSKSSDDLSLFGAVNELVEGRGAKAIFVTSNLSADSEDQRSFDSEVREKLVWKVFSYEQSAESLVNDIFGHLEDSVSEINIIDCVLESVRKSNCVNVRVLLKVEPIVTEILKTNVISDRTIFLENRKQAFVDIVMFALMFCDGRPPVPPKRSNDDNVDTLITVEYLNAYQKYEKYKDASFITSYFGSQENSRQLDLDQEISAYIQKRYPLSEDSKKMLEITSRIGDSLRTMSDSDVISLASEFAAMVRDASFLPSELCSVVSCNMLFYGFGINEAVPKVEMINCCKLVIDRDPKKSLSTLNSPMFTFGFSESVADVVKRLSDYAKNVYTDEVKVEMANCLAGEDSAREALRLLENIWDDEVIGWPSIINASDISSIFFNLDPKGQQRMILLFRELLERPWAMRETDETYSGWFVDIKSALTETNSASFMTELRKGWFLESIDDLLKQVSNVELRKQVNHVELS